VLSVSEYKSELNYVDWQDLAPGKDDSLDHICEFLINGCPLFDCPTAEERSRTTADEDAFFEELAHSPDYLRSDRLERWLRWKSLGRPATDLVRQLPFGAGNALLNLGRARWHAFLKSLEIGESISHERQNPGASKRRAGF